MILTDTTIVLPPVLIGLALQRTLVQGLIGGAVKDQFKMTCSVINTTLILACNDR